MIFAERVQLADVVNVIAFEILVNVAEVNNSIKLFNKVRVVLVVLIERTITVLLLIFLLIFRKSAKRIEILGILGNVQRS